MRQDRGRRRVRWDRGRRRRARERHCRRLFDGDPVAAPLGVAAPAGPLRAVLAEQLQVVVQRLLVERSARPRLRRAPGHAVVPRPLGLGLGLQIRLVEGHVVVVVVAIVVDLEAVVVVVGLVGRAALVGRLDGRVLLVGVVVVVVVGVEVVAGRLDGRLAGLVVVVVVVVVLERLGHDALDELLPLLRELEAEAVRDGRVDLLDRVARARHRVGPDPGHDLVARVARVVVVDGRLAVRLERVARVVLGLRGRRHVRPAVLRAVLGDDAGDVLAVEAAAALARDLRVCRRRRSRRARRGGRTRRRCRRVPARTTARPSAYTATALEGVV